MKIFPASKVREIDAYTIKNEPIASIDLMERAASRLVGWYVRHFKTDRRVVLLAGPGNNGGDALAMARLLAARQYRVICYLVNPKNTLSEDNEKNLERLKNQGIAHVELLKEGNPLPGFRKGDVVVDGMFGSGLTRPVSGFFEAVIHHINREASTVVSIDIPSGLFGEDNTQNDYEKIVQADFTLTFQFPFLSFLFAENERFVGKWRVLDIGLHKGYIRQSECAYSVPLREEIAKMIPARNRHDHKGRYGHALIIAGSYGMMGAAVLSAEAALRTGAGLVTGHIPAKGYTVFQTALPEAIASIDPSGSCFTSMPGLDGYQAIAAGPGMQMAVETKNELRHLLENVSVPLVLDADALNILAGDTELLELIPANTILTPHPGEFDRLAGSSATGWLRHLVQREFSARYNVITVLKGGYTGISMPDGRYFFNTTGNPGMATGGSGDVLTGIIVSLLAQGLSPETASIAGVYLHGVAGDLAAGDLGKASMLAGDITRKLGDAFIHILSKPFLDERRKGVIQ
jgi:NAD(P)H-hydrate epimerase